MTCLPLTFDTLVVDGVTPDANGTVWTWTVLDGWFDSPPVRVAQQEIPGTGETITLARQNARPITLELVATLPELPAPAPLGLDGIGAARVLAKTAGHCVFVPHLLIVTDVEFGAGHLSSLVRRVGTMKDAIVGDLRGLRVQYPLLAPDPLRYEGVDGGVTGTGHE